MQPEFEVAWHGSLWRDDRSAGEAQSVPPSPEPLPSVVRPFEGRGGRKPVVRLEVERVLRDSALPLSALEIHARLRDRRCTVAGVASALHYFRTNGQITRAARMLPGYGQYRATYRWAATVESRELDAITLRAKNVENGRLGGLKSGESRRRSAAS